MGIVHAKETRMAGDVGRGPKKPKSAVKYDQPKTQDSPPLKEGRVPGMQESPVEMKPWNLERMKARVDKVHVDGLARTKDDIVRAQVSELFKAQDFQEVVVRAGRVRGKLESLGCFRNIGVYIDTSQGPDASPEGVEVTFTVREMRRFVGGINTMVGNNDGSVIISGQTPNLFGRGERLQMEYTYALKHSSTVNVSAVKPFVDSRLRTILTGSIFTAAGEYPWSGYKQWDSGFLLDLALNPGGAGSWKHNFQYEAAYREISAFKQASFSVREECGPNLKSVLRHVCSIDKRDETLFPTAGSLIKFTTEVAGLGGDIGFVRNELVTQCNWTLLECLTFQLGLQSGLLRGISDDMRVNIADRFFLGGPMNVRGFEMRGVGPRRDGNALGGNFYWAAGLHLYTPLPFRPCRNGFGDLFRLHGFVNAGCLSDCSLKFGSSYEEHTKILANDVRVSAGGGIAMKLGNVARIELNFVAPLKFLKSDPLRQFQFGIGVQYL